MLGAVEAGGTKFNCAVGRTDGSLVAETRIATGQPADTLAAVIDFFAAAEREHGFIKAFGIGSFGPLHLDRGSPKWGFLAETPKPGWADIDMVGPFQRRFGKPVAFDTDVNRAALGELTWGAARGCGTSVYITVGTGVGGGAVVNGRPVHGLSHPEMGHIKVPRHNFDGGFPGVCPFHGDCVEGLISGPSIQARFGRKFSELEPGHPFRGVLASYVGQLCAQIVLMLSPQRIVLGGGVMEDGSLYGAVSQSLQEAIGGYIRQPEIESGALVVPPGLGQRSGIMGALALAREALPG